MSDRNDRGQFLQGRSGNPAGRPKGSRNKLGEELIAALHEDFALHGADAIVRMREANPVAYLRVVASLMPKEMSIRRDPIDDIPDDELDEMIAVLRERIAKSGEEREDETDE